MTSSTRNYVFIDESGDPGFKIRQGSSPFFCMAAVVCCNKEAVVSTERRMAEIRSSLSLRKDYEFHFTKESPKHKRAFCEAIVGSPFAIRAIVIDKKDIHSDVLRSSPKHFYNYVAELLLRYSFNSIVNAVVTVDGKIKRDLKTYLRQQLNKPGRERVIHETRFRDSKADSMVQLADMMAGTIIGPYKSDGLAQRETARIIEPHLEGLWLFGRKIEDQLKRQM